MLNKSSLLDKHMKNMRDAMHSMALQSFFKLTRDDYNAKIHSESNASGKAVILMQLGANVMMTALPSDGGPWIP